MNIYQVDAFTEKPCSGNPAAVCILEKNKDEEWMQKVAREMNLSETAFLVPNKDGYNLRWFTPNCEVDLCGHATLASAHVLWEKAFLAKGEEARFYTKSGLLTATYSEGWIKLNFPATPDEGVKAPPELLKGLGINPVYIGKNTFDFIIEVENEEIVKNIKPDFTLLQKVPMRGVIVTARGTEYDFVSRFFAPRVGINEDPVTGSAHCCLGPYWMKRMGKNSFSAYQVSDRGGELKIQVSGERVYISGKAVTVMQGKLFF